MGPADTDLGLLSRDQVPLPELAEAAFLLDSGTISRPIKTDLGWHIVRVGEIQQATVQPLREVRDEIRRVLAEDKAVDELFGLANRFEDALGGGGRHRRGGASIEYQGPQGRRAVHGGH